MVEEIRKKICGTCNREFPLDREYFYVDSAKKDGFSTHCKSCMYGKNNEGFNFDQWFYKKHLNFQERWTYSKLKYVYDNYKKLDRKAIMSIFKDEKYKTITNIIYQWNIRRAEKSDEWSEDDIDFLINNYPFMPQKELELKFPDRTWVSIKMKASKLEVYRNEEILLKIRSESHIGYKHSEEARKNMGLSRKGKKSPMWKGGVTPLHPYLRDKISEWKFESLKLNNFACIVTGINDGTLHVHHLYKSFSELIQETFNILHLSINPDMTIYSQEELKSIDDKFVELHYKNGYGVPITAKLHRLFHQLYGKTNNTPEQFEEFKIRYKMGEFKEVS